MKREWLPAEEVAKWGAQLGEAIRRVVLQLHLVAPNIVGLSVPDAETLLKEKEDDILQQLNLIEERIDAAANESEQTGIQANGESLTELLRE